MRATGSRRKPGGSVLQKKEDESSIIALAGSRRSRRFNLLDLNCRLASSAACANDCSVRMISLTAKIEGLKIAAKSLLQGGGKGKLFGWNGLVRSDPASGGNACSAAEFVTILRFAVNKQTTIGARQSGPESGSGDQQFQTTHWSVVLAASQSDSPHAVDAVEKLCRIYWPALYAFIVRQGYPSEEAKDLTQEFFARLWDKQYLRGIRPEGGRFRSFLLTMLKHFLVNEWRRSQCQKRGGGKIVLSLDELSAVPNIGFEPAESATPEVLYEKQWALTVLKQAMDRLRQEYLSVAKEPVFERLQIFLSGDKQSIPYAEIAGSLDMSPGAVKVAVHRLRRRYGEIVRQEVAQTVAVPEEIEDEIRHLFAVLSE
jgi:RNA polymerase sigma factor (sigma-70 family)